MVSECTTCIKGEIPFIKKKCNKKSLIGGSQTLPFTSFREVVHLFLLCCNIFSVNKDRLGYFGWWSLTPAISSTERVVLSSNVIFVPRGFLSCHEAPNLAGSSLGSANCDVFPSSFPYWSSPTDSEDFCFILKRINMQLDSQVQRRVVSLSCPAHLGILPHTPSHARLPN